MLNEYRSIDEALPAVGAVPPDHFGVTADPSIWKAVARYAVTPFVIIKLIVIDPPIAIIEFSVVDPFPLKFRVTLEVEFDVK